MKAEKHVYSCNCGWAANHSSTKHGRPRREAKTKITQAQRTCWSPYEAKLSWSGERYTTKDNARANVFTLILCNV